MKRSTFITWDQLKVGSIILAAIVVIFVALVKLDAAVGLFTPRYELVALLDNASGLRVGGSVTVAGQLAGTVKEIEFLPVDEDTLRNLRVTFEIDEKLKDQVRRDSQAKLRTLGLLGDKVLDISPGTPQFDTLHTGDTITVAQSLDYEQVIAQAAGAVDDMVGLTADLREITGGIVRGEGTIGQLVTNRSLYTQLEQTLAKTNQMLTRLQQPNGTFARLLDDPALYNNMTAMIASVDTLVGKVSSDKGTVGQLLSDTTLYRNLIGITQRSDSLLKLLTSGQGTAGKLMADQALYDQILKMTTDLNALLTDFRLNPKKYLKGIIFP
jgi:phospholipid/cholesterol/gamma-HCH transport system substrate-binding protein